MFHNNTLKPVLLTILITTFLLGAGCLSKQEKETLSYYQRGEDRVVVLMNSSGFLPESITIEKGMTVDFTNEDFVDRKPVFDDDANLTPEKAIPPLGSWSVTFENTGKWGYFDTEKQGKTGMIIVK